MQSRRHTEANILGYRLDRIESQPAEAIRYEVTSPDNGIVLAHFPDRPSAERFIVMRELRQISTRPRNPAF